MTIRAKRTAFRVSRPPSSQCTYVKGICLFPDKQALRDPEPEPEPALREWQEGKLGRRRTRVEAGEAVVVYWIFFLSF